MAHLSLKDEVVYVSSGMEFQMTMFPPFFCQISGSLFGNVSDSLMQNQCRYPPEIYTFMDSKPMQKSFLRWRLFLWTKTHSQEPKFLFSDTHFRPYST